MTPRLYKQVKLILWYFLATLCRWQNFISPKNFENIRRFSGVIKTFENNDALIDQVKAQFALTIELVSILINY